VSKNLIVNRNQDNLKKRLDEYLPFTKALDVLVGYFYAQGFHVIKDNFFKTDKIRILVGMGADETVINDVKEGQQELLNLSDKEVAVTAVDQITADTIKSSQSVKDFESLDTIRDYVKSGKLQVHAYRKQQLHAKLYILHTQGIINGAIITGSSNLTQAGLETNLELNVLLTDEDEYITAKELFNELWDDAVDISELLVEKIISDTWLEPVDPAAIFYRAAYEYIGGSKAILEPDDDNVISGRTTFKKLKYQDDAARQAVDIIRQFKGVFLADVVGLGKTVMGALVLRSMRNLGMRKTAIVICAPGLIKEWQDWTSDIGGGSIRVYSSGDLPKILYDIREGALKDNLVNTVLIDESHNFRNASSDTYSVLQNITNNKNVILLSATPQSKSTWDISSQLNLFADPADFVDVMEGKSFKVFFDEIDKLNTAQEKAHKLDALMRSVMIRRTRSEILKHYQDDILKQGLTFPTAADPEVILYDLAIGVNNLLPRVEELIGKLKLPRFQPREFIKDEFLSDPMLKDLSKGGQQLRAINRILIFKRLESSVYAVRKTLIRQLEVNKHFMHEAKTSGVLPFGVDNKKLISIDIEWLLDDDENYEKLLTNHINPEYKVEKFNYSDLEKQLQEDNLILEELLNILNKITPTLDNKLQKLINQVSTTLSEEKTLIFTESKETAEYLQDNLNRALSEEVGLAHGLLNVGEYEDLKKRFSPDSNGGLPKNKKSLRVLVSTDTFSEGVNLQDANHVINYDIPWNPIRIIQRVGRVNRVGSRHKIAYSYNYFPTDELDEHIGSRQEFTETLLRRVRRRIDEYQAIIGDDSKHLSPDEQPEPHKLFKIITKSVDNIEADDPEYGFSELLAILRELREKDPEYYDYVVERVPKKAWTARVNTPLTADEVVVVAKRNKHVVFYEASKNSVEAITITPTTAFKKLYAKKTERPTLKRPLPQLSEALALCEKSFSVSSASDIEHRRITSASFEGRLKSLLNKHYLPTLPKDLIAIINQYKDALDRELIRNRRAIKRAYETANKARNAAELVEILNSELPLEEYAQTNGNNIKFVKPEILLSCLYKN